MKITTNQTSTYNYNRKTSFGSLPICRGVVTRHLTGGTSKQLPVEIHLLRAEDSGYIEKIKNKWARTTRFGELIALRFLENAKTPIPYSHNNFGVNFLCLKPVKSQDFGSKEPIGLAVITRWQNRESKKNCVNLNFLQTAGRYLNEKEERKVSGCGEMLLYGIFKLLKDLKCEEVFFESTLSALSFYEKLLHMKPNGSTSLRYRIDKSILERAISEIEEKHGLPTNVPVSGTALRETSENSYFLYLD